MGVTGLLGLLKSIQKPCSLKAFSGQTLGVDAYGWLHRASVSCALELAQGKSTTKLVDFAMHRVRMLLHFGVTPYIVFDGDRLPSKADVERGRAQRRERSRTTGLELLRLGKIAQAYQELQKAVDITPEIARQLIDVLESNNIDYVVAPYEADAQLAYLERKGIIDGILSEDSDLLVFGAKCLLTKLDQYGECVMIRQEDFTACRDVNFVGWTCSDFRHMAILSGCDYLGGLSKMGLRTAHRLVRKYKTTDRIIRGIQMEGKFHVPAGYAESFTQAEYTFLYQWVYCPEQQRLVNLTKPDNDDQLADLAYFGSYVEPDIASLVATGRLHPMSKKPIVVDVAYNAMKMTPSARNPVQKADSCKPSKSIDQFFKPKRVPLAEMDPNTFASYPSQQQLLQQNSHRRWAAAGTELSNSLLPVARDTPATQMRAEQTQMTASNPLKRPRLCLEATDNRPTSIASKSFGERSKFFDSSMTGTIVPSKRGSATRKSAAVDFNIWSDDSIEDALVALPDLSSSCTTSKSSVPPLITATPCQRSVAQSETLAKEVFSENLKSSPQALIVGNDEASVFDNSLLAWTRELREKYSRPTSPSPHQHQGARSAIATESSPRSIDQAGRATETSPQTPSQIIRGSAMETIISQHEFPVPETPLVPVLKDAKLGLRTDFESGSGSGKHIQSRLAFQHETLHGSPQLGKGSEDLMLVVPDSDFDYDLDESEIISGPRTPISHNSDLAAIAGVAVTKLDLRRFTFAGAFE